MIWGNLADALYWSPGRRTEATKNYQKALVIGKATLQVNADDVLTLAYLADYSIMVGDEESANQYLRRALKLAPTNGEVLFRAAIVLNHLAKKDEAFSCLKQAIAVGYSKNIIRDTPDFANIPVRTGSPLQ